MKKDKLARTKPYYLKLKDPQKFLKHYLNIYNRDYGKSRARKIISLFPKLKYKKVLDIGCGGGFYSLAASKRKCKDITLVDISPVCVKAAKLNLKNAGLSSEGVIADASYLPLKSGGFDFVLCIDLIEHLEKDHMLLCEIRKVLKDNGLVLIATQNSYSINYLLEAPIQRYVLKNKSWMGWDPTHKRFYTQKRLIRILGSCGLACIKIAGNYFIPYLMATWFNKVSRRFSRTLYQILKLINDKLESNQNAFWSSFGWGLICLCVKMHGSKRTLLEKGSFGKIA